MRYEDWATPDRIIEVNNKVLLGATREDIAKFIGIDLLTLGQWEQVHEQLRAALSITKEVVEHRIISNIIRQAQVGNSDAIKAYKNWSSFPSEDWC